MMSTASRKGALSPPHQGSHSSTSKEIRKISTFLTNRGSDAQRVRQQGAGTQSREHRPQHACVQVKVRVGGLRADFERSELFPDRIWCPCPDLPTRRQEKVSDRKWPAFFFCSRSPQKRA